MQNFCNQYTMQTYCKLTHNHNALHYTHTVILNYTTRKVHTCTSYMLIHAHTHIPPSPLLLWVMRPPNQGGTDSSKIDCHVHAVSAHLVCQQWSWRTHGSQRTHLNSSSNMCIDILKPIYQAASVLSGHTRTLHTKTLYTHFALK